MKPKIKKDGNQNYEVIGKSGNSAGSISRVGTQKKGGWLVYLLSSPSELYESFTAAKRDAIARAERY
jgi:hypothetical protein